MDRGDGWDPWDHSSPWVTTYRLNNSNREQHEAVWPKDPLRQLNVPASKKLFPIPLPPLPILPPTSAQCSPLTVSSIVSDYELLEDKTHFSLIFSSLPWCLALKQSIKYWCNEGKKEERKEGQEREREEGKGIHMEGSCRKSSSISSVQSLSPVQLFATPWITRSMPGLPLHHQLPEFTQTHVHQVGDAIQSSHPLSSPSLPAPNPSQHQGLFQWVNSSHEVAKVLEFQLQHQSFQWTPRTDLL